MDYAIEARDLRRPTPATCGALNGLDFAVEPGTVFGLLGPERRRQVDDGEDPHHADARRRRHGRGGRPRRRPRPRRGAPGDRRRRAEVGRRPRGHRPREPAPAGPASTACAAATLEPRHRRAARPLRPHRRRRPHRPRRTRAACSAGSTSPMALVHRPSVLFLDEPTTGLDPEVRAEMWGEIERLAADEGLTILLTTHYLEEADRLAERLAIVDRGRSSPRARPTSSRATCTATPSRVELRDGEDGRGRARARARGRAARDQPSRAARCAPASTTARRAVPRVLQALEAGGVRWPR